MKRFFAIFALLSYSVIGYYILRLAPVYAFALAVSVISHEAGHIVAARLLGTGISSFSVHAGGLVLRLSGSGGGMRTVITALAGPAAGILPAIASPLLPAQIATAVCGASLTLTLLNLLPVSGFDGGRVLSALPFLSARMLSAISLGTLCALWMLSVCFLLSASAGFSLFLFCAAVFVPCIKGDMTA